MSEASNTLLTLVRKKKRRVAGVMSGTSLDGVDVVVADLHGSGPSMTIDLIAADMVPYPEPLASLVLANSSPPESSVRDLSQLNFRLADFYAMGIRGVCADVSESVSSLDLIGCHGQTVYHVPQPEECAGEMVTSTLQLGDGSVLANRLGVAVVSNFRAADMALGGQGAPLVPYFDFVQYTDDAVGRVLLNLGGIANITVLPRGAKKRDVIAFDTGPANIVMNYVANRKFGSAFDEGGRAAAEGVASLSVLKRLLEDEYFRLAPPKSTGREVYNSEYADRLEQMMSESGESTPEDLMATALELTVESIALALERFVFPDIDVSQLFVSGGGAQNRFLMQRLSERLGSLKVESLASVGLDPDYKEALCFAVLAHEYVNGTPTNVPSATGASGDALLGELALPLTQAR